MQPSNLNPRLQQQLKAVFGDAAPPEQIGELLNYINNTYNTYDAAQADSKRQIQHRTEQLIASTSQAYSFLDSLNRGFIMCDTSGEVVLSNSVVNAMLVAQNQNSDKTASVTINSLEEAFGPEISIKAFVTQCLQTAQPVEYNKANIGQRIIQLHIAPLTTQSDSEKQLLGVVMLLEDVTEQTHLERSKDEFLSIASHELRTPLTAIRGNTVLFKKLYGDKLTDPDMIEMINDIYLSSVRLINIVNDFLDVATMEQHKMAMNPEDFAIAEVINEVVHELSSLSNEKGLALVADPSTTQVPNVRADRQRIKQVVINLVSNAIKFTDKGSVTLSASTDDGMVYVSVKDTGKGMSEKNQQLLFHKFQQAGDDIMTRATIKGTGLGLYICKQIVELSGGSIELKSSIESVGSEFVFSLPTGQTNQA